MVGLLFPWQSIGFSGIPEWWSKWIGTWWSLAVYKSSRRTSYDIKFVDHLGRSRINKRVRCLFFSQEWVGCRVLAISFSGTLESRRNHYIFSLFKMFLKSLDRWLGRWQNFWMDPFVGPSPWWLFSELKADYVLSFHIKLIDLYTEYIQTQSFIQCSPNLYAPQFKK